MKKLKKKTKQTLKKYRKIMIITAISLFLLILGFIYNQLIPALIIVAVLDFILFLIFKPKKHKFSFKELFKTLCIIAFTGGTLVLLGAASFTIYVISLVEPFDPEALKNVVPSLIVDSEGNELMKIGDEHRKLVTYDEISQSLIDAVIATEDSRYYQHSGVDLPRFILASLQQAMGNSDAGGASTLTMQVSKLTQTDEIATGIEGIIRKFHDVYISVFELERRYTKEEILEFYLNYVGMGGQVNGMGQASLTYFNKDVSELNIAESAMLAGMLQAPSAYNPLYYPDLCEERRVQVLNLMLRHGYITEEEYNIAKELTVEKLLVEAEATSTSDYQDYLDAALQEVIDRGYNPYNVSMVITINMDSELQTYVDGIMDGDTFNWTYDHIQAGAAFIDVDTGQVKAIAGGRDRAAGDWNFATQNKRQIGSTAKPIYDYGPAIEYLNYSTASPLADEKHSYSSGMNVNNFDDKYKGLITFEYALENSRNTTAIKLFQENDPALIEEFARNLGLSPEEYLHEAHALGGYTGESPLTLAAAYAAFSNGGYYIEPTMISKIELVETGEVVNIIPETTRVMSEATAYMITKILEKTGPSILGSINGVNYTAKTGTTDLSSDVVNANDLNGAVGDKWLSGYNDEYAVAMWMGFETNTSDVYNIRAFDIRNSLYRALVDTVYTERSAWDQPSSVVKAEVEIGLPTVMLASEGTPEDLIETHYFKKGFEPTETSDRFTKLPTVTNVNYDLNTGILTWDPVAYSNYHSTEYLTQIYDPLFNDAEHLALHVESVIEFNNEELGQIVYEIYTKDIEDNLVLIGTTATTEFTHFINSSTDFVIVTSYEKHKLSNSEWNLLSVQKTPDIITSNLTTDSTITLSLNAPYVEYHKPVIVLENGTVDVTAQSSITTSITRQSDNFTFTNFDLIDTSKVDVYTITYTIQYKSYTNVISKIIEIK